METVAIEEDDKVKVPALEPGPPAKRTKKQPRTVASGPQIVLDMSWDQQMTGSVQRDVVSQLTTAYNFDKSSPTSLPMVFTSVQQRWQELFHRSNAARWNRAIVTFKKEPLCRAVPPNDLIYLVPDSPNVCASLDPARGYVIGCLIGDKAATTLPGDFARQHEIRTERLPVEQSEVAIRGFTIGQLVEVLVRVANGADWKQVIEALPQVADESGWCYHVVSCVGG
jgi:hypothetical protein